MSWRSGIKGKRAIEMATALKHVRDLAAPYKLTDGLAFELLIQEISKEKVREQADEATLSSAGFDRGIENRSKYGKVRFSVERLKY